MFTEIVNKRIVDTAPDPVLFCGKLLNRQITRSVICNTPFQHASHKRPILGMRRLQKADPIHHLNRFLYAALHHPCKRFRHINGLQPPVVVFPHKNGIIIHLINIAEKVRLGFLLFIVCNIRQEKSGIRSRKVNHRLEMQMQIDHRHIGRKGMRLFRTESIHHMQRILIHQSTLLQIGSDIVVIMVYVLPIPCKNMIGIHNTIILQTSVLMQNRLIHKCADRQVVVGFGFKGQGDLCHKGNPLFLIKSR